MIGVRLRGNIWGPRGIVFLFFTDLFSEFSLLGQLTGPANHAHISTSSFVRSFGAGLFPAWADPDYGWESDVSGDAPF